MNETTPDWLTRAQAFRADDPDPDTQRELDALLAGLPDLAAERELADRFSSRLAFGTAGLRGLLGAGDNRINRRAVAQATAALCAELLVQLPDAACRGLCIGFDGRHKSREFAEEAAAVASGAGFVVYAFESPVPTPVLAFAVLSRNAAGGIMITASHNPAAYNGLKVYWHDALQLNPPHDAAIAARIARGPDALALPRLLLTAARTQGLWSSLEPMRDAYLNGLAHELEQPHTKTADASASATPTSLRVAYTALHGVGEAFVRAALSRLEGVQLDSVVEQAQPDPDFPSVRFPNPEEQGAMDLVLELAKRSGADLALANDPDADRLAVAARTDAGALQTFTGNDLGVLLADYLLTHAPKDGRNAVVTTVVSTPLTAAVARAHGARIELTLTGFKWIARRAYELELAGLRSLLCFEEALGYCVGLRLRDKDGIAAAGHVVRMAQWHQQHGRTLHAALEALYRQHGLYESVPTAITLSPVTDHAALGDRLRQLRTAPPTRIAGLRVTGLRDLLRPESAEPDGLPKTDLFVLTLDDAHRVSIRPSGTEPKLKIYIDGYAPLRADADLPCIRGHLRRIARAITDDLRERLGL